MVSFVSEVGCQFGECWQFEFNTGYWKCSGTPTRALMALQSAALLGGNDCQCRVTTQLPLPHWPGTDPSSRHESRGRQNGEGAAMAAIHSKPLEGWVGLVIVSILTGREI